MFDGHYQDWREKRINKIFNLYPKSYFNNKSILELGCGYGDIGKEFLKLGANVIFAEGREEHLQVLKQRFPPNQVKQLNQEENWNFNQHFDIIIHWGVLYHINNWKQDLECTLKHANLIFLESEVADSSNVNLDLKITEHNDYDQALQTIGSRPSANNIENFITSKGFRVARFDHKDLNSGYHTYDWSVQNSETWRHGLRRFWIVEK